MNATLTTLTGTQVNNPRSIIEQGYNGSSIRTAGCLLKTQFVNSICTGLVLAVGKEPYDNTWSVTVEVNSQKWIRYCNLFICDVNVGQKVQPNDSIGASFKGLMRLEYCTAEKSQFPVRALNRELYKHDPTPVIFGGVI